MTVGLVHFLIVALILFSIGLFGVISSRNVLRVLMSIELMFSAVCINLVAFANYSDFALLRGQIFSLFTIAVIAAETSVGLAILISLYRNKRTVDVEAMKLLKG